MSAFIFPLSWALVLYLPSVSCSVQPGHPTSSSNVTYLKSMSIFLSLNFFLTFLFLYGTTLLLSHSFIISQTSLILPLSILRSHME